MIENNSPYQKLDIETDLSSTLSEYDQVRLQNKNSTTKSVFTLVKVALGMGIIILPYLFSKNGYLQGTLIIIAVALNMYFASSLIIRIADDIESKNKAKTIQNFEEVALHLTGREKVNLTFFWFIKVETL